MKLVGRGDQGDFEALGPDWHVNFKSEIHGVRSTAQI